MSSETTNPMLEKAKQANRILKELPAAFATLVPALIKEALLNTDITSKWIVARSIASDLKWYRHLLPYKLWEPGMRCEFGDIVATHPSLGYFICIRRDGAVYNPSFSISDADYWVLIPYVDEKKIHHYQSSWDPCGVAVKKGEVWEVNGVYLEYTGEDMNDAPNPTRDREFWKEVNVNADEQ